MLRFYMIYLTCNRSETLEPHFVVVKVSSSDREAQLQPLHGLSLPLACNGKVDMSQSDLSIVSPVSTFTSGWNILLT